MKQPKCAYVSVHHNNNNTTTLMRQHELNLIKTDL